MGCCASQSSAAQPKDPKRDTSGQTARHTPGTVPADVPLIIPAGVATPAQPFGFYQDTREQYRLKDITFFGSHRRILLQSANGPCPLLALCNVLLLRNQLQISADSRFTSFSELVEQVGNVLFDVNARATTEVERLDSGTANVRASAEACLETLPKLSTGLDVNCIFGGPSQFEFTQELAVFDLLDIGLYHGWVVSNEDEVAYDAIAPLSYNQLVEKLIAFREQPEASGEDAEKGRRIAEFMDRTASQLSEEGILALQSELRDRQLVAFYRNGHFSTMVKYEGQLYLLCSDQGFATTNVVWERLDEVSGNTTHCDANFQEATPADGDAQALAAAMAVQEQMLLSDLGAGFGTGAVDEADPELMLALQLSQQEAQNSAAAQGGMGQGGAPNCSEDELLAMRLMQEELQAQDQAQTAAVR